VYELADWTPADQGDLEHVYTASVRLGAWTVEHRWRRQGERDKYEARATRLAAADTREGRYLRPEGREVRP
jgi:hypothetical protein